MCVNPVLELLGGIREFKWYFIERTTKFQNKINKYKLSFVTSRLYYNLFYNDEIKKKKIYNSSNYLKVLNDLYHEQVNIKDMKINDILIFILYILDEELKKDNSIITEYLNYLLLQIVECTQCHNQYFAKKSFSTFQLNICNLYQKNKSPGGKIFLSLYDCLDDEINNNGKSFKFYCDNCHSYIMSNIIHYKFTKTNKKLIFLLQQEIKFYNDTYSAQLRFKLDEKINIKKYLDNLNNDCKYELIGIISANIGGCDCVCFLKSYYNQKWYLYLDEYTEEKGFDDILKLHYNGKYAPFTLMYSKIE